MLSQDIIDLVLTGVDTVADIYVDNTLLRSVYNAHRFAPRLMNNSARDFSSPLAYEFSCHDLEVHAFVLLGLWCICAFIPYACGRLPSQAKRSAHRTI